MSNGYPMSTVLGRREVMESAQRTFISSSCWTDRIGPTAALAAIGKLRREDVPSHLEAMGLRMRKGWQESAERHGLDVAIEGIPALSTFHFRHGEASQAMATLYTQEMLDAGFLASGAFYVMYAHTPEHVDRALEATDAAFARIHTALEQDSLEDALRGPVAHGGFRRLT